MKQATKRLMSSATALVLFAATFFVFFSFVSPAFQAAEDLRGEEIGHENVIATQKEITDRVKHAIAEYQGEGDARDAVAAVLPLTPDVAAALAGISGIAGNNHLALQSVSLQAAANETNIPAGLHVASSTSLIRPIGVLNFQMKLAGSYGDFKSFLQNLETNMRIADVKTLTIEHEGKPLNSIQGKQNQDNFLYTVVASMYYQNQ